MISLTQQDLDVRLQLASCCIGEKTVSLLGKIKIGSKDVNCNLMELKVAQGMLNALRCYDVSLTGTATMAAGTITVTGYSGSINISVNGISITGTYNSVSGSATDLMTALTAHINSYQSVYTATFPDRGTFITLSGTCDNETVTVVTTGELSVVVAGLTDGVCTLTNCLTELQVQAMFEYIGRKCNICFQHPGFSYT